MPKTRLVLIVAKTAAAILATGYWAYACASLSVINIGPQWKCGSIELIHSAMVVVSV